MKTLIGCETCIYGYLAIDGAGYYCSQPEYKKIECVKNKLAHYVAQLDTDKIDSTESKLSTICDFCGRDAHKPSANTQPVGWMDVDFKGSGYSKLHACPFCARWIVFISAMILHYNQGNDAINFECLQDYFPTLKKKQEDKKNDNN